MANEMRDRLVELIETAKREWWEKTGRYQTSKTEADYIADCLLDDGWIRPPCKVGDTLWVLWSLTKANKKEIYPVEAYALRYDDKMNNMRVCVEGRFKIEKYDESYYTHFYRGTFPWESVGKTVFLTKAEAEQKLKEMRGGNG